MRRGAPTPRGAGSAWRLGALAGSALCLSALPLVGCDLEGLADLGETLLAPEAARLDAPGEQLIAGRIVDVDVDYSGELGVRLLAVVREGDEDRGVIYSLLDDAECDAGPGSHIYGLSDWAVETGGMVILRDAPATLAPRSSEDAPRYARQRLVDFECRELAAFDDAEFPFLPPLSSSGVLVRTSAGELFHVDGDGSRKIASDVRMARSLGFALWVYDGAALTSYDAEFQPTGSAPEVDELFDDGGIGVAVQLVYRSGGAWWRLVDGVPRYEVPPGLRLRDDACALVLDGERLHYFAPCAERRALVQLGPDLETDDCCVELAGPPGVVPGTAGRGHVEFFGRLGRTEPEAALFVTSSADAPESVGQLHYAAMPADLDVLLSIAGGLRLDLDAEVLGDEFRLIQGAPYRADSAGRGTLYDLVFERKAESAELLRFLPLAEDVQDHFGGYPYTVFGLLADWQGETGTFLPTARLTAGAPDGAEGTDELVLDPDHGVERVPTQDLGFSFSSDERAFVGEVEGATGRVYVAGTGSSGLTRPTGPFGERVLPGLVRTMAEPGAVAYLTEARTLRAYLLDAGLDQELSEHVSFYWPLPWPLGGVAYVVDRGQREGLWLAKAR